MGTGSADPRWSAWRPPGAEVKRLRLWAVQQLIGSPNISWDEFEYDYEHPPGKLNRGVSTLMIVRTTISRHLAEAAHEDEKVRRIVAQQQADSIERLLRKEKPPVVSE